MVILPSVWYNVLVASLTSIYLTSAAEYGVGFSLALDYGVASIYFPNGSIVDLVKVEGGSAYKQMMRPTDSINFHPTSHIFESSTASGIGIEVSQASLGHQNLRDYLPPWVGGPDPQKSSLTPMLKALKAAAETYLEVPLIAAEVVFPFHVSDSYLNALRSACSSLSLQLPLSAQPPAGILAARAYGIGGKCDIGTTFDRAAEQYLNLKDEEPQLILTVDYSGAALTALLVFEECGIFEYRRTLHDSRLGADALSRGSDGSSQDDLWLALHKLTTLPLNDGGDGAELKRVREIVLLGERADDTRLHEVLKEVLPEQYRSLATAMLHEVLKEVLPEQYRSLATAIRNGPARSVRMVEPLYAASRGLAEDCWGRLNFARRNEL